MPDDERSRVALVANERTKLSAAYMNGLAIAVAVVGGFSPILSGNLGDLAVPDLVLSVIKVLICLVVSGLLHLSARRLLKDLR